MQQPPSPSQPDPASAGKAVLKAGSICFLLAIVSILAQPVLLVFIHGPLMTVCVVLAIIAIAKDQVKRGVQLLLASIFMLPMIFALSLFLWFVGIGAVIGSFVTGAHSTTSAMVTPSAPTRLVSKQTPISLDSLKNRFLDQIRTQKTVSIADFRTDQEIEIEIQPESNFDSAKVKNAALTVAKGWQELSGLPKVSVSIWQGANLLAREYSVKTKN
jgi:hypothetical protein